MMYSDQEKFNNLVLDEIKRREGQVDVLVLFNYKNNLPEEILEQTSAKITLVATDTGNFPKDRVDRWAEDPFKFVDLAMETRTKFDLILLINPEEFFKTKIEKGFTFEELHKEFIRNLQFQLLKESGIIILLTHKQNFKLDDYIRPGADKLTKKVLSEEEREKSSLQAYAFYR